MGAFVFWTSVAALIPLVLGIFQQIIQMALRMGRLH
jgi:hypothetical protein